MENKKQKTEETPNNNSTNEQPAQDNHEECDCEVCKMWKSPYSEKERQEATAAAREMLDGTQEAFILLTVARGKDGAASISSGVLGSGGQLKALMAAVFDQEGDNLQKILSNGLAYYKMRKHPLYEILGEFLKDQNKKEGTNAGPGN